MQNKVNQKHDYGAKIVIEQEKFVVVGKADLAAPFNIDIYNSDDGGYVDFIYKKDIPVVFQKNFDQFHSGKTYQIDGTAYWDDYVRWARSALRAIDAGNKH